MTPFGYVGELKQLFQQGAEFLEAFSFKGPGQQAFGSKFGGKIAVAEPQQMLRQLVTQDPVILTERDGEAGNGSLVPEQACVAG